MATKQNGYTQVKRNARRQQKQHDADNRQLKYEALPYLAKLALISGRRGESKRELARLYTNSKTPSAVKPITVPTTVESSNESPVKVRRSVSKSKIVRAAKTERPSK